jgi:single-stranded-DNA-specific exonuclease
MEKAQKLDEMNVARRAEQDEILAMAIQQAERMKESRVLVVSHSDWNHGIVGIVAAKLLEKYKKPAFVLQEMGEQAKGSARSYGDFSAADAIRASDDLIIKGGGHKLAAGVSLLTANIAAFRDRVNAYFESLDLPSQQVHLLAREDVAIADFSEVNTALLDDMERMEPFGSGNPEPILKVADVIVMSMRRMGADGQHIKIGVRDNAGGILDLLAFNASADWFVEPGETVSVWFKPTRNEWRGSKTVEGMLVRLERL